MVRRHDRDRFQTALFAPARNREALFALYAFNYEIARVREIVSEPILGQIRLQWWREVIAAAFAGEPPRQHAVALPLTEAIRRFNLTRDDLDRLVDTRERDLAAEPPSDLAALEDYAEGSSAALTHLALGAFGVRTPEARAVGREVGIGYALAGLLRALPFHAAARRYYLSADLTARAGLDLERLTKAGGSPGLRAVVSEIADLAAKHLCAARKRRRAIPRSAIAALLPAIIAERFLARLRRAGYDPFAPELNSPDPLQSWRLAAAALRNRF
jgi:phytoene synthase